MIFIDVVIPTRGRLAKLERCLRTIPQEAAGKTIRTLIICDHDQDTYNALKGRPGISPLMTDRRRGSVFCRNTVIALTTDAVLYATDDIEFYPGAIQAAVKAMEARFPDDDGVIGFHQEGNGYNPAGVALVGRPFIDRFPGRRLFFPGYYHFACQEVHRAAEHWGRFHLDYDARIKHWHPGTFRAERDQTHDEARIFRARDLAIKSVREKRGLIWGIN